MPRPKGSIPWNKGKKGVQIGWNKGLPRIWNSGGDFRKGRIPWNKNKKTGIKPWLGKKRSLETIDKLRKAHKGQHHSEKTEFIKGDKPPLHKENCDCFRCDRKVGIKNILWKGGVTPENKKQREVIEYKIWRDSVFKRDKYLCQMPGCDKIEHYIHAHHIKRFIDYTELRFEVSNGITLCKNCHNKTKGKEKKFESMFIEILKL